MIGTRREDGRVVRGGHGLEGARTGGEAGERLGVEEGNRKGRVMNGEKGKSRMLTIRFQSLGWYPSPHTPSSKS